MSSAQGDDGRSSVGRRLSSREAEQLLERIAEAARSDLPLAEGLEAAAGDCDSRRLGSALRSLAGDLRQGTPLAQALSSRRRRLPQHVAGLVAAASRTGQLGDALARLTAQQRAGRDSWRMVRAALAYPLLVLGVTLVLFSGISIIVVPPFTEIVAEFGLQVPYFTRMLFWWSRSGIWTFLLLLPAIGALLLAARLIGGAAIWNSFLRGVPLLGAFWQWSHAAQWCRSMAALVEQNLPLPEALQLAAESQPDAVLAVAGRRMAASVAQGAALSAVLLEQRVWPLSMVPVVRWGERTGQLAEAFAVAGEMFEGRMRLRALLLKSILPAVMFLLIWALASFTLIGLVTPLVQLIRSLG